VKTLVALITLGVVAVGHISETPTVRAWQDRQAARIECAVVVTAVREDLVNEYCAGRRP
jgi:hypothetical protein